MPIVHFSIHRNQYHQIGFELDSMLTNFIRADINITQPKAVDIVHSMCHFLPDNAVNINFECKHRRNVVYIWQQQQKKIQRGTTHTLNAHDHRTRNKHDQNERNTQKCYETLIYSRAVEASISRSI